MMDRTPNCLCICGATQFQVFSAPLLRVYCHCTICQRFNNAPFADVTIFRTEDVRMPAPNSVQFKRYKSPPAVQRGSCSHCGSPAIELVDLPLLPKLVVVPTANIKQEQYIPRPSLHIFYDKRVAEIDDSLDKYHGFARSQLALSSKLIKALLNQPHI
ncbi:GFA family protein [Ferrimonas lipolytica]|uniref:CENP-V/GFA domain-containing protein n=1 Tax=Ferrimonas lipolytica TaxID=2724191 RepID=A0A6H1UF87_9GAMM|nr:GFA family protein [Ferrimonas lipolytica]QIZ76876.1 hypothetical protein HER31_08315 [Ferrimonas lipolytica]